MPLPYKYERPIGLAKFDTINLDIADSLHRDGSMTFARRADFVALSAHLAFRRSCACTRRAILTETARDWNLGQLDKTLTTVVKVTLSLHQRDTFERFEAAIVGIPAAASVQRAELKTLAPRLCI
ncbi:hypothetical protein P775_00150 [Puniceibacterium antarcticum]|uniref:Uncharacterized protein n=1 Tax=Puniceibacterium antarcticum TaxID=1206336 RepID=A0A2G8RL72_9RHOB|nr:hypothetical protein P775_00150 [Puniceibacterium antarcticum]